MMTEEEKKQEAEATKKRIANKIGKVATETATVATLLTPTIGNAQTAEQSAEFSPAPIEQTISAMPSQTDIMSLEEAQKLPTFGSEKWIEDNLKQDCAKHDEALKQEITALQTAQTAQTYNNQLSQSLDIENPEVFDNMLHTSQVGNISYQMAFYRNTLPEVTPTKRPEINQPKDIFKKEDFRDADMNKFKDKMLAESARAAFDKDEHKIIIYPKKDFTAEQLNKFLENGNLKDYEYAKGNPFVDQAIKLHEHSHLEDWEYNGQNTLTHPIDIAKADRLTEIKAYAVENLYIANQYTLLKSQGMETIEINGEKRPIDSLLEIYPNLKETVKQIEAETGGKGFDAQNPAHVRKVVEASSQYWHKERLEIYNKQHVKSAKLDATASNIFDYVQHDDQAFGKVSKQMVSNKVYIGNNTSVDLSGCEDLLNTLTTEDAMELLSSEKIKDTQDVTYGDIQKVDEYLTTEKSLATTEEKASYFSENVENIVTRRDPVDEDLKQIMVNTNNENNNTIIYADNLTEKTDANGHRIITGEKGSIDLTAYQEQQANQNLNAELQQHRQNHDAELARQTAMLTTSPHTQANQTSNASPNTISTATLLNMQQNSH